MAEQEKDRVAMPSLKADGTPDQTANFEVLDEEATKKQAEARAAVAAGNEAAAEQATAEPVAETATDDQPKRRSRS